MELALEVDSVESIAGASMNFWKCACLKGLIGKLKMLPKLAEVGAFFPKDGFGGPVQRCHPARQVFIE